MTLRRGGRMALVLLALGLFLALLDWQIGPPAERGLFREDPDRFWTLRPDSVLEHFGQRVTVNSLGFRGPEPPPRQEGDYRVMVLGDSCIFGHALPDGETLPVRLEEALAERWPTRRVVVFNLGTPGYSSHQGLDLVRRLAPRLEPDAVVAAYLWADQSPDRKPDAERTPPEPLQSLRRALWRSNLYRRLRMGWLESEGRIAGPERLRPQGPSERVPPQATTANLVALARASGAREVLFVALPSRSRQAGPRHLRALRAAAEAVPGARFLNLDEEWRQTLPSERRQGLFMDPVHLTAEGCREAARMLAGALTGPEP